MLLFYICSSHFICYLPNVSLLACIYFAFDQNFEKQRYGSIYRNGMMTVSVNTAKLLEEVLRNDDKFPNRGDMSTWKEHRDMRGYGYGPFTE